MNPAGGTELLYNNLLKYVGAGWQEKINLILSFTDLRFLDFSKKNVIWQHLYTDQGAVQGMHYPKFTDNIDQYVYVSDWQLAQFIKEFNVGNFNNTVIKNAIDPIEFKVKPSDKIRLIYTSMPNRGLEILLDAWDIMNRSDIELTVYSSNIIYGKQYSDSIIGIHDKLFDRCRSTPGISYKGYGLNQAVRKSLQSAHILAYPSIYPETSCLAAIEAGAAGCKIVTTNYGALPETCDKWATYVPYSSNYKELVENYATVLSKTIDEYSAIEYNIKDQSMWFNEVYSWNNRTYDWIKLFNLL